MPRSPFDKFSMESVKRFMETNDLSSLISEPSYKSPKDDWVPVMERVDAVPDGYWTPVDQRVGPEWDAYYRNRKVRKPLDGRAITGLTRGSRRR